jgi:predicted HD superfamily hydrolase involved in NAD metabolism
MTETEIKKLLKERLKPSRYEHTISVADTAMHLAKIHGADEKKAYLAGLLHDCAKCMTIDELKEKTSTYNIVLDEVSQASPQLLHSYVGAYEAKYTYKVDDEEILDAIYHHTTGKAAMSKLCAIVYLADAIEPLRVFPDVDIIRETAEHSLEKAVFMYSEACIRFVLKKGNLLHPNTVDTRNYYITAE